MSKLKLNFPTHVTKTGYYKVGREIDGVKDEIEVLIWADSDLEDGSSTPPASFDSNPDNENQEVEYIIASSLD